MANVKAMAANFAAFLVFMVCFGAVLTSCSGSEEMKQVLGPQPTEYIDNYVYIDRDKLVNVISNVYFDGENMTINGTKVMGADVQHTLPIIEMAASEHAAAAVLTDNGEELHDSNGQLTREILTITPSKDNSYSIFAELKPADEYSTLTSLHKKVSMVTTRHNLTGHVSTTVADDTKSADFNFKLNRSYLLVDPSVDTKIINTTDTLIQVEVRVDTLVNNVEIHDTTVVVNNVETIVHDTITVTNTVTVVDTLKIEVEKFIKGADINKSVINDLGYSIGTLTLGNNQLLKVTLNHRDPVLNVEKSSLGNVSFSNFAALQWKGSDDQQTTGTKEANNVTVKSFDFLRCEYTKVSDNMYIVKTIYQVTGSFYNENSDICEFTMELAPSYLQKYDEVVVVPETVKYRGIIRKVSVEDVKLMCKPIVQKWNNETNSWEDVRTAARCCIGMSGKPSGLDLFVKGTKIIEETENSWWYTGTDATWNGDDTKNDGTVVSKKTKIYEFNHMFEADAVANGKVGPATQLYVMRAETVKVLDPDNNLLTCTWEDGSEFSLNISVVLNNTEFVEDASLVGQTRTESDKTYKYATSFVQYFNASIGGNKLADTVAKSNLWTPVQ
jgi:hypothetical protein